MLTSFFRQFLVLIALFGAVGQTMVYAQPMTSATIPVTRTTVSSDCAGMTMKATFKKSVPCQGLTLDCIAKMGCVPASALPGQSVVLSRSIAWTAICYPRGHLTAGGLTVEPEVFPPIA